VSVPRNSDGTRNRDNGVVPLRKGLQSDDLCWGILSSAPTVFSVYVQNLLSGSARITE
jgi:hypothetical protein